MLHNHITFPGAIESMVPDFLKLLKDLNPKPAPIYGKSHAVDIEWYGGGYVSDIEDSLYYYFKRANNVNFGYDINNIDALRLENYKKGGWFASRIEQNHFLQDFSDRKLTCIVNLNPPFDPNIAGGKIILTDANGHTNQIDDVFYKKTGAITVFSSFQKYAVEEVKADELKYLFGFCVGSKWK